LEFFQDLGDRPARIAARLRVGGRSQEDPGHRSGGKSHELHVPPPLLSARGREFLRRGVLLKVLWDALILAQLNGG
jgi:hypothetical protein